MGEAPGFESFFETTYEGVVRSLTIVFGDRDSAEDAAQVGFERAYARWARVSAMDRPGTWVYVVALRHGRKSLKPREQSGATPQAPAPDQTEASADRLDLAEQVRMLPPRQRAVIVLRHLAGLELREIGDALGVRTGTVKSTLHAAHQRLRIEMQTNDSEEVRRGTR